MKEWVVIHTQPNRKARRTQQRKLRALANMEFKRSVRKARKFKMTEEHLKNMCLQAQERQGTLNAFIMLPSYASGLLLKGGPQGVPVNTDDGIMKFDAQEVLDFLNLKKEIFGERIEG